MGPTKCVGAYGRLVTPRAAPSRFGLENRRLGSSWRKARDPSKIHNFSFVIFFIQEDVDVGCTWQLAT